MSGIKEMATGLTSSNNAPVIVNLGVEVAANGDITVFGQAPPTVNNVIVAEVNLPKEVLYDASNSLIEFWEPSYDLGSRRATLSGKVDPSGVALSGRDYTALTKSFVYELQQVLQGNLDCSGASPFDDAKYAGIPEYQKPADFGRLALSVYAHYLFGHVAATAAITNDKAFMEAMLSQGSNGVYKYADATAVAGNADGSEWVSPTIGSSSDADLARLLVGAITTKDDAAILAIAEQVLGQDASRAMDQDNNALPIDVRHALKFIADDVIYMNIKLTTPNVTIANAAQKVSEATLEGKYTSEENYTIKITLA
jgi:hypothetical protein